MQPAAAHSLYDQLLALPEGLTGEILNGQIHTRPRPTGPHTGVESALQIELGGPGGWRILVEPEVHFVRDTEVCVPDPAGWHQERLPQLPRDQRFDVVPDWVCEILPPSTESKDRQIKMPIYARYGVAFAWLIDPLKRTLEAFALEDGEWRSLGAWVGDDTVSVPPFEAVRLGLGEICSWPLGDCLNGVERRAGLRPQPTKRAAQVVAQVADKQSMPGQPLSVRPDPHSFLRAGVRAIAP